MAGYKRLPFWVTALKNWEEEGRGLARPLAQEEEEEEAASSGNQRRRCRCSVTGEEELPWLGWHQVHVRIVVIQESNLIIS
ncbi:hypothetical protein E2320_006383 [Naja naja]|nr:hypothetical protein E2320_006383 [Naja naja]